MIESEARAQAGLRIQIAGHEIAVSADNGDCIEREKERIEREATELSALGVRITRLVLPGDGGAPRYEFAFPEGELQYKTRLRIEKAGFDVGQRMGSHELTFYASRRTERSDGWAV